MVLTMGCSASKRSIRTPDNAADAVTLVLVNAQIFTARDESEVVEALAIAGDKIAAVGSSAQLRQLAGPHTRIVDLEGKFVGPGFHDAHQHFEGGGRSLAQLNFYGVKTRDEVLARVAAAVKEAEPGRWIVGRGWDHTLWSGAQWPTRQDLDRVAPDHPVYLRRADGHVVWVNSKALTLAGVTDKTPDPPAGVIEREAGSRQPSGILKEAALELIEPVESRRDIRRFIALALEQARRRGVTSVQDGGSDLEELIRLREAGELTVRIYKWGELDGDLARYAELRRRFPPSDSRLVFGALKGFVDGTLGSSTAALLEPFADKPESRGILNYADDKLEALVARATRAGFQVALHAIGDRGARQALRAYAKVADRGGRALRHRVEHVQVVHPDDLPLFSRAGVIASIQPCHLITDQRWVDQRLGPERARQRGYLWKTLHDRGVPLALGTDWPVEPLDPLRNLYAAVTRRRVDPPRGDGWSVDQRLTLKRALRAYTYGSAFAAHLEQRRGTLAPGQDADLVVLDREILGGPPEALLRAKVQATVLGGKVVFGEL
jgi:predicted amidohydrolase YtcJ